MGLLGGKLGLVLYNSFKSGELSSSNEQIIQNWLFEFNNNRQVLTFCDGLAGFNWLISFLGSNGIIKNDWKANLSEIDNILQGWMLQQISQLNYDFLHGAIGACNYFLTRSDETIYRKYVVDFVDAIEQIAIKEDDEKIKFFSYSPLRKKIVVDLGMAHGLASIVYILSQTIKADINVQKSKNLLQKTGNYLISCSLEKGGGFYSTFPSSIIEDEPLKPSRLAWCYGDLGIGIALYQAATITGNREWEQFSMDLLMKCTKRQDLKENGVVDAGLCHGTSGIGQVFYRMYVETKNLEFKIAADYWFTKTIEMFGETLERGEYLAWKGDKGWIREDNFLEGSSGIELALYCWKHGINPEWDTCLLLS